MTIVVEDGTGKVDAVSYADDIYADAYFTARGFTNWVNLLLTEKENALVRATDYMQVMFTTWTGTRKTSTQALDWPRVDGELNEVAIANNVVPKLVKDACCELAIRAAAGPLLLDPAGDDTGRLFGKKVDRAGPVEEERTYIAKGQMSVPQPYKRFPVVELMLKPLVRTNVGFVYR